MYTLPDSSKVWMEKGSQIKYQEAFNENRKVWLSGNSLFDVRKQKGSTFRVYIEKAYIEVKGTSFRIEQEDSNQNNITLFNGKIEFCVEETGEKTMMKPLDRITYNSNSGETELSKVTNLDWENGKYHFTDIPLQRLIRVINHMYDSKIILEKDINCESAFTGSIRYDEPLEDVVNKICFTLNLKNEMHEGSIIIKSE